MDTSKEYIDMCNKATEIQTMWMPFAGHAVVGDVYAQLNFNATRWDVMIYTQSTSNHCIWLPRQDQLQDMLDIPLSDFNHYCTENGYKKHIGFIAQNINLIHSKHGARTGSMEQLWLTIVMYRKYGKRWNGTGWVMQD